MRSIQYVVITPQRDEENNLPRAIESMVRQTLRPFQWIIVDDGSKDRSGAMADEASRQHCWIQVVHRADRGQRKPGGGVIEAFYDGHKLIQSHSWDFLVKLDGDLSFQEDYFEKCFAHFEQNKKLGIGGGTVCRLSPEGLVEEVKGDPRFHVRGATKIYRRACWEQIGGLLRAPGWDTIDEVKANMLGWETYTFPELKLHQGKDTGSADGNLKNWIKNGRANYITGYHPLFMFCKCLRRLLRRPYLVASAALFWGFISGYFFRIPRVPDPEMIRFLRRQQIKALLLQPSMWS